MSKVRITVGDKQAFCWLNSSKTASLIYDSLPLKGRVNVWGEEIFCQIPVDADEENARELVNFGDVAYWPQGNCFCIFFGQTPLSQGNEIRATGPVNILGRIISDPRIFRDISGTEITIEKLNKGVECIAIGTDEHTPLLDTVIGYLKNRRFKYRLFDPAPWPDAAEQVSNIVSSGQCDEGILFCWTGTGVSLAANKFPGVRAALCSDAATASGARKWNHANILVMSLRLTSPAIAEEIMEAWFSTPFSEEEVANISKIAGIERKYLTNPCV